MQMQVPWFKPAAWGVVVGAIGTMIVGFSWLGWTLDSTAERMATERTSAALVVALTPLLRREIHAAAWRRREAGRISEDRVVESAAAYRSGWVGHSPKRQRA
jgi:hypothetical protein